MFVACNAAICFAVRGSRLVKDRDALGELGWAVEGLKGACWLFHNERVSRQDKSRAEVAERSREHPQHDLDTQTVASQALATLPATVVGLFDTKYTRTAAPTATVACFRRRAETG